MGENLTDGGEVLYRQIHPDLIQDGEPASSGFRPNESDKDMLSVDRGSVTSPADSHSLYTKNGLSSVAVYGVSVAEFGSEGIPCKADPLEAENGMLANSAHALASFAGLGISRQRKLGKKIKNLALARGLLHPVAPVISGSGEDSSSDLK